MKFDLHMFWLVLCLIPVALAALGRKEGSKPWSMRMRQGYRLGQMILLICGVWPLAFSICLITSLPLLAGLLLFVIVGMLVIYFLEYEAWNHPISKLQVFAHVYASFFSFLISWIPEVPYADDPMEEWKQVEHLEEDEQEVLRNALEFADTTIDEIMTHRSDVVSLSLRDDPADWKKTIMENRHTFYPVTNENDEDIIGVLDTRDYFRLDSQDRRTILKKTMEPAFFAAENTNAVDMVQVMKRARRYFAVVLDEYGGMSGIVTIHDILEELLGEMNEVEDASRESDLVRIGSDSWRINGQASLDDVSKALGMDLKLDNYETFAGYIIGTIGRIPEDGSQFEVDLDHLHIYVRSVKNHRIMQTIVHTKDKEKVPAKKGKTKEEPSE